PEPEANSPAGWGSRPCTRSWIRLIPAAAAADSSGVPKVNASIASTVRLSRPTRAHRSAAKPLWSATPWATRGWAIWSRMARPHPARSTISRWSFHVVLSEAGTLVVVVTGTPWLRVLGDALTLLDSRRAALFRLTASA